MLRSAKGFMALGFVAITSFISMMAVMPYITPYISQDKTASVKGQDIVIVQDFDDNIPLPSEQEGWVFSQLTATAKAAGSAEVHLVDSNTTRYGVANYKLTQLDPAKKLGISINIRKNRQPHNILLLRIQYPNGQTTNCSFDTQTGKKSVRGSKNTKPTAQVKDMDSNWLLSCTASASGDKTGKALLRLFPGAGSTERALSAKATGKVDIMQILLEH